MQALQSQAVALRHLLAQLQEIERVRCKAEGFMAVLQDIDNMAVCIERVLCMTVAKSAQARCVPSRAG